MGKALESEERHKVCGICRSKQTLITSHINLHHKEEVKKARNENHYEVVKSKTCERPYVCTVNDCQASYRRKDHLTGHLLRHEGKTVKCPVENCNLEFLLQGNMERHVNEIHDDISASAGEKNHKQYVCPKVGCGKVFKLASELRKHEDSHVMLESVDGVCLEPGRMKLHLRTHEAGSSSKEGGRIGVKLNGDGEFSHSSIQHQPTVEVQISCIFLHEWWLVKQPKGLAVGGVASMGRDRERVFMSSEIAERQEVNVLQTEDSITVILRGFINMFRSCQNGFSSEVCRHFLFGFPHDWKKYADHSFGDENISGVGFVDSSTCSKKRADDNCLLLNNCSAPKKICNGLGISFGNVSKQSKSIDNMECGIVMKNSECQCKDNTKRVNSSQPQADMMYNSENQVSDVAVASQTGNPESDQSLVGTCDPNPCTGLSGKNMVKSPTSINKVKKDQFSRDHNEQKCVRQKIVKDTGNSCSRMVTRSISKRTHTMLQKDKKATAVCVFSPVRRSPRLYS